MEWDVTSHMTGRQVSHIIKWFNTGTLEAWGRLAMPAESATADAAGADPSCTSKCDQNRQANTRQVGYRQAKKSTHKSTVLQKHCRPSLTEHRPGKQRQRSASPATQTTALHAQGLTDRAEHPSLQELCNSNVKQAATHPKRAQKVQLATTIPLINRCQTPEHQQHFQARAKFWHLAAARHTPGQNMPTAQPLCGTTTPVGNTVVRCTAGPAKSTTAPAWRKPSRHQLQTPDSIP